MGILKYFLFFLPILLTIIPCVDDPTSVDTDVPADSTKYAHNITINIKTHFEGEVISISSAEVTIDSADYVSNYEERFL